MPCAMRQRSRRGVLAAMLVQCLLPRLDPALIRADERGTADTATEEAISSAVLRELGATATGTFSRPNVPPGAKWTTPLPDKSLLMLVQNGKLHVTLVDGRARIARFFDPLLYQFAPPELGPGQEVVLDVGDRLVARGDGAIVALNTGAMTAVASVTRVTSRTTNP